MWLFPKKEFDLIGAAGFVTPRKRCDTQFSLRDFVATLRPANPLCSLDMTSAFLIDVSLQYE